MTTVVPSPVAKAAVTAAIQLASVRRGIDFSYLLAQAKTESGLDATAASPTSSARGVFQFTRGTWLETIRRHGAGNGLGWAADAVANGAAANDPATREAVLDLRNDPAVASAMAASYAGDNAKTLGAELGRATTATDLYLAHFLGAAGALRLLKAMDADPTAAAAAVVPVAAQANRRVFFAADGSSRSLQAVYDHFSATFGGKAVPATGTELPVTHAATAQLAATPDFARTAYLLLAELSA